MKINTFINTYYEGLTPSDTLDPLQKTILNANRFVKVDDNTIMSCEDVLKSVLDIFQAVITQIDGEWYIYKPNELYSNKYPKFRRYNELGVYIGLNTKFTGGVLGSQIDNFYPHHCGGNQRKKIKGAISAFRLGYKYGFVSGLLGNNKFFHEGFSYPNWTINSENSTYIITDPLVNTGLTMRPDKRSGVIELLATSNPIALLANDIFKLKMNLKANGGTRFSIRVKLGIYNLTINGEWVISDSTYMPPIIFGDEAYSGSLISKLYEIQAQPLPVSGNVEVNLYVAESINATIAEYHTVEIVPTVENKPEAGEFHTVQRKNKPSSIVKANNTVYSGDNAGIVYLGAIFKEDLISNTSKWFRRGTFESKPLLQIAAEEELRIQQKPMIDFYGDIKGEMPYLSAITINNIQGKFMPIEWDYDTVKNVCTIRYLELYAEELDDIDYVFTFDYGNTVKPTIKG